MNTRFIPASILSVFLAVTATAGAHVEPPRAENPASQQERPPKRLAQKDNAAAIAKNKDTAKPDARREKTKKASNAYAEKAGAKSSTGTPATKPPNPGKAEPKASKAKATHEHRLAKLQQLRARAEARGRSEMVQRVDRLIQRENARYEKRLSRL
jgi:hypothetical protein